MKLTKKNYTEAINRLKLQKKHKDKRIFVKKDNKYSYPTITMSIIARELDVNRSTLYLTKNEWIKNDLLKYKKILKNKNGKQDNIKPNTLAYYKQKAINGNAIIEELQKKITKLQEKLLSSKEAEIILGEIDIEIITRNKDFKKLYEENKKLKAEISMLKFKLYKTIDS
jgi:transposase-like protein